MGGEQRLELRELLGLALGEIDPFGGSVFRSNSQSLRGRSDTISFQPRSWTVR